MKTVHLFLPVCLLLQTAFPFGNIEPAQTPALLPDKSFFRLGDQLVSLEKYALTQSPPYVLVNLHSNETASIRMMMEFVQTHEVGLVRLLNNEKQNVETQLMDKKISFDPNTIFTGIGRRENLKNNQCWNRQVAERIASFAQFLSGEIPHSSKIVMLESGHGSSITDYLDKGSLSKTVKEACQHPGQDPSAFYYTSEEHIFTKLKEKGFNVVLHHPKKIKDDGSLQVYCSRASIPYVSIVTGTDQIDLQKDMLTAAHWILQ